MKITEEIKDELFIEFCDMDANNELCLYKDSFKEAIAKALSLCGVSKRYELTYMLRTSRDIKKIIIEALSEDEALGKLIIKYSGCIWLTINDA